MTYPTVFLVAQCLTPREYVFHLIMELQHWRAAD